MLHVWWYNEETFRIDRPSHVVPRCCMACSTHRKWTWRPIQSSSTTSMQMSSRRKHQKAPDSSRYPKLVRPVPTKACHQNVRINLLSMSSSAQVVTFCATKARFSPDLCWVAAFRLFKLVRSAESMALWSRCLQIRAAAREMCLGHPTP